MARRQTEEDLEREGLTLGQEHKRVLANLVEAKFEIECLSKDSALLDALLDPEGPFEVRRNYAPDPDWDGGRADYDSIHTRADIDEVLKEEPDSE